MLSAVSFVSASH